MNREVAEWWRKKREQARNFFVEYGKITAVIVFIITILIAVVVIVSVITPQMLRVSFLNVGQGDAIFLETPSGHHMLIDGGPSDVVLSQLHKHMNVLDRDIDVVVATHPDADHVTGLVPVFDQYHVQHIVSSGVTSDTRVAHQLSDIIAHGSSDVHIARAGDVIDFGDGVSARVLYPYQSVRSKDTNSASVCLLIVYGDESFLLTGDLPSTYESFLLSSSTPHHVTVYKAGHHGSKHSSGNQLLSYIRPEYAVISAGKDNRYGHPDPETIARLQMYSNEILSTIDRGTITFTTDGRMINVTTDN